MYFFQPKVCSQLKMHCLGGFRTAIVTVGGKKINENAKIIIKAFSYDVKCNLCPVFSEFVKS